MNTSIMDSLTYMCKGHYTVNRENGTVLFEFQEGVLSAGLHVSRFIMNTRETAVREALIKLGWTPPTDEPAIAHRGSHIIPNSFCCRGCKNTFPYSDAHIHKADQRWTWCPTCYSQLTPPDAPA